MEQPIEFLIRAGQADTVDQLREYAVHRLSLSLRRFERRIRHITVDCRDHFALMQFWREVLEDYHDHPDDPNRPGDEQSGRGPR